MFDFIRTHQRLMQFVLLLLIVPSFVFFGIQGYERFNQSAQGVAKVAGQTITQGELDNAQRNQLARMRQNLGAAFDPAAFDTPEARARTLDGLITQYALVGQARKQSLLATDNQLRARLMSEPSLQENGQFSNERYQALLAQQGMSPLTFEARLREDLATQLMTSAIESTVMVPAKVVDRFAGIVAQRRTVSQATFKAADFRAKVTVPADAVQKDYDAHPDLYMTPESAKVEYVVLSADALAAKQTVSEQDAREFYDKNRNRYEVPEQRRASHILVAVPKDAGDADKAKAKAKAEDILAKVKAHPGDFARLAKQYSEDPGSAANGGDLDFVGRGAMVPPFDQAMFSMKQGDIGDLVQSDFGYHIITVTAIKPAQVKPFEAVRAEIESEIRKQLAQKQFSESAEAFANSVYEQGDSLAPTAKTFGLAIQTADKVTRTAGADATGPLANAKLRNALFSADSLKNRHNTEAIETTPGTLVSARVVDYAPAAKRPLAEVADAIRARLVDAEARKLAAAEGQAQLAALRDGKAATAAFGPGKPVGRLDPSDLPADAVSEVFRADAAKLPAYAGLALPNGDYAIYRVDGVAPGAAPDPTQRGTLAQSIERQIGSLEFGGYLIGLRERSKVKVYPPYAELMDAKPRDAARVAGS